MDKQTEYQALREEILGSIQVVKSYRSLLYTVVIAILAFALDKDEAVLFLVPFAAIIPLYLLSMHQIDSAMRIGAYIYVFLEDGTDCQWETRLYMYDKLHKNQYSTKKSNIDPYWCTSLSCLALSVIRLDYSNRNLNFYIIIVAQAIILLICIYIFLYKRPDYLITKEKYIREWKEIQLQELNLTREGKKSKRQKRPKTR